MKRIKQLLVLSLVLVVAGSCTKLQESPEPSGNNSSGSGGGGNSGDPAVYIGLWKLTDLSLAGTSLYSTLDTIYSVQLQSAGLATFTFYDADNGNILDSKNDNYLKYGSPVIIDFSNAGPREVTNKTGSQIVWKYQSAKYGGEVTETLTKQ